MTMFTSKVGQVVVSHDGNTLCSKKLFCFKNYFSEEDSVFEDAKL